MERIIIKLLSMMPTAYYLHKDYKSLLSCVETKKIPLSEYACEVYADMPGPVTHATTYVHVYAHELYTYVHAYMYAYIYMYKIINVHKYIHGYNKYLRTDVHRYTHQQHTG